MTMKPEVIETLKQRALAGDGEAQYQLGNVFARGESGGVDLAQAAEWYRKAGEQGHADALCNYAFLLHAGEGVAKNEEKAYELFEAAANQGQVQAQLNLGILSANDANSDTERMLHWFRIAANNGSAEASYNLGMLYFEGKRVPQDYASAFKYFVQSAEAGYAQGEYSVGFCFSKGLGTEKDASQAAAFFKRAAEKGHASAQYNLGLHFEYGEGVDAVDTDEAIFWFQKAANQGHPRADEAIQLLEAGDSDSNS